jgi:hypothetical protein
MSHTQKNQLREYQQNFVDNFLSPSSERAHLVVAPHGSGFGICVDEIVSRVMQENLSARVLLLTERSVLVQQWMRILNDAAVAARSLEGSRHNLRELSWSEKSSESIWPESSVVVMLTGSIQRFDDIRASVFQTPWDLMAWDGFVPSPSKVSLLRELVGAQNLQKILVMSRKLDGNWHDLVPGMALYLTDWSFLLRPSRVGAIASITIVALTYQLTPEETELRARIERFAENVASDSVTSRLLSGLIRAADSSPLALREHLRQFNPSRASIAVGEIPADEHLEPQDFDDQESDDPAQLTVQSMQYMDEVRKIQESLDDLPADSKLEAMLKYVAEQGSDQPHTIIWCRFAATARYLKSALMESEREVFLMLAADRPSIRLKILEDFGRTGGFLVATFAAMKGLECSADSVILYDAFADSAQKALEVVLRRVKDRGPLRLVSFADDSGLSSFLDDLSETK